jgi:hypothetical protein
MANTLISSRGEINALDEISASKNTFNPEGTTAYITDSSWTTGSSPNIFHVSTVKDRTMFFKRLCIWWRERKSAYFKAYRKKVFSPNAFFKSLKKSLKVNEDIAVLKDLDIDTYMQSMIDMAKRIGQTAYAEKLEEDTDRLKAEIGILSAGYKYYVDEKDVVANKAKLPDELKLTFIKNYTRVIPKDVVIELVKAIEAEVFDNFCVLHYDPTNDAEQMTKAEVEKAKDPILFGVAEDSRKLFFIADWLDEYCDWTLDKLLAHINVKEQDAILTKDKIL